jgi:hypothetical protein
MEQVESMKFVFGWRRWKNKIKRKIISLNWHNLLSGEKRKSRDDVAYHYWSVFEGCVTITFISGKFLFYAAMMNWERD